MFDSTIRERPTASIERMRWLRYLVLIVAAGLFAAEQISINGINGWWSDELFSLWASDTSLPLRRAFAERIGPDSNPPLYFTALYATRLLIAPDRLAVLALNILCILASISAVLWASRKSSLASASFLAAAAFVLSGPVAAYAPEGRSYLLAMTIVFATSWLAVLAVTEQRHNMAAFAVAGILAGLTHPFAALFCGCLAAGLLALAVFDSARRDLAFPALVLGVVTYATFGTWLLSALGSLGNVGWIEFSVRAVRDAVWFVRKLVVGSPIGVLPLAALLLIGVVRPATRALTVVFGIAFALFILLPMIASFKQPIVSGRYWMIGAPALTVLIVAMGAIWYKELQLSRESRAPRFALLIAVALALLSDLSGFFSAREFTQLKPIWLGASAVRPLIKTCPNGSVRIGTDEIKLPISDSVSASFAYMAEVPPAIFVDVADPRTPVLQLSGAPCPLLAWAEHVRLGDDNDYRRLSDADLLRIMKIEALPQDVEIHRHLSGFYIVRRQPRS